MESSPGPVRQLLSAVSEMGLLKQLASAVFWKTETTQRIDMLIDLNFEDSRNCLLFHEGENEYLHCAWDMGGAVIAVEYIPCNWPSLTLCSWPSVADWWHAVESVSWLQDDLLRLAPRTG